jgi:hypothetical protein
VILWLRQCVRWSLSASHVEGCENPWRACLWQYLVSPLATVYQVFFDCLGVHLSMGLERPPEIFVEISDDGEVVNIVWLLYWWVIFADVKGDSIESHFAMYKPAELASAS